MNKRLLFALTACAAVYGVLPFFPLLAFLHTLIPSIVGLFLPELPPVVLAPLSLNDLFFFFGLCFLFSLLGRLCAWILTQKLGISALPRRLLTLLFAVLCALLWFFASVFIPSVLHRIILSGILVAAFFAGSALYAYNYDEIMNLRTFRAGIIFYIVIVVLLAIAGGETFQVAPFAGILFFGLILLLFGMNQGGMDGMMRMRRHPLDLLPQKIRRYNLRLISMIVVLLLLLTLAYQPVAAALTSVGNVLYQLLRQTVAFLTANQGSTSTPSGPSVAPPPVKDPSLSDSLGYGDSSPFWDYFGWGMMVLIGIALIYYSSDIYRILRDALRRLREALSQWLHRERKHEVKLGATEYTDTDEYADATEELNPRKQKDALTWSKWRQNYRRYTSMAPSDLRLRRGYGLIMEWLKMQEVPLKPCDTTLEIVHTVAHTLDFSDLNEATTPYNLLRYGDRSFDLCDSQEMDRVLEEMAHTKTATKLSRLARAMKEENAK